MGAADTFTLKSDRDAIKSSSSLVAVDAVRDCLLSRSLARCSWLFGAEGVIMCVTEALGLSSPFRSPPLKRLSARRIVCTKQTIILEQEVKEKCACLQDLV